MNTMRQSRINRTNALMLGLVMASACGVSYGADVPLVFGNEDIAPFSAMQINKTPSLPTSQTTTLRTRLPVLCGSATSGSSGANFVNQINPTFPGFYQNGDFKFGTISGGEQAPVPGIGYWNYSGNGLTVQSDGKTSCYVLSANGERKDSTGLFSDTFEPGGQFDASVSLSVASLPTFSTPYYTYYIDVRIPADLATSEYRVRDGFDSSVFAFGGPSARHCKVAIGVTTCGSMTSDNVDDPSTVPSGGVQQRYIVQRLLQHDVLLPPDVNVPVVFAALYFVDGADTNLANNVAAGRGTLSDLAPVITAASDMVPTFAEGTAPTNLSFVISDDTSETGLPQLDATVTIDFNGNLRPASHVSCAQVQPPQQGEGARRTCTFDIPVFDADFATDFSTPGTYATGVHAAVRITATDSRGQTSTATVPFHVASSENDAPTFDLSPLAVPDGSVNKIPTLTCSLSAPLPLTASCLGIVPDFVTNLLPGPALAADEIATQGVFLGTLAGNKLSCTGTSPSIFSSNLVDGLHSPRYIFNGTHIDLDYSLKSREENVTGSADCSVAAGDYNFPSAQVYRDTSRVFRIVVVN